MNHLILNLRRSDQLYFHRWPRLGGRDGGIQDIGNVWAFVKITINHRICHEIQNKGIVPVSSGLLCQSKATTTAINGRDTAENFDH